MMRHVIALSLLAVSAPVLAGEPTQPAAQSSPQVPAEAPAKPKTKLEKMMAENPVFGSVISNEFPLSPKEIGAFQRRKAETERAIVNPAASRPPSSRQSTLVAYPERTLGLHLAKGFASTLRLTDAAGNPLRVFGHTAGSDLISVATVPEKPDEKLGALALTLIPNGFGATNLTVYPSKGERPLVIDVTIGAANDKTTVDYQSDIRLNWVYGSAATAGSRYTSPLSDDLLAALREQPKAEWRSVRSSDAVASAWRTPEGLLYIKLRAGAKLLSPRNYVRDAYDEADGAAVYQFQNSVVPALVVAHSGHPMPVRLGE